MDNKSTNNINSYTSSKILNHKPQIHEVTKPENLFSKLNFNDGYELIDRNIFNISTPKIVDVDVLDDLQKYDYCGRYITYTVLEYI